MEKYIKLKKAMGIPVDPETKETFFTRFWKNLTHGNPEEAKRHKDKLKGK